MKTTTHRHRIATSHVRCFSGPVSRRENRAAHGNICQVSQCKCGAEKRTNINQGFVETSGWIATDDSM